MSLVLLCAPLLKPTGRLLTSGAVRRQSVFTYACAGSTSIATTMIRSHAIHLHPIGGGSYFAGLIALHLVCSPRSGGDLHRGW